MTPTAPPTNPATFNDAEGRPWAVRLDFALMRRIRSLAAVDLGDIEKLALAWASLLYDDEKAAEVLWLCVEAAATHKEIDRAGFERGLNGDVLEAALNALKEAIESFTQPRKRGIAASAMNGIQDGMKKAIEQAQTKIQTAIETATTQALQASGSSPPAAPAS